MSTLAQPDLVTDALTAVLVSIRLLEGQKLLVSLPFPALKATAVESGTPTHWEGRGRDGRVVVFGDAADELIASAPRIERGAAVIISDFEVTSG